MAPELRKLENLATGQVCGGVETSGPVERLYGYIASVTLLIVDTARPAGVKGRLQTLLTLKSMVITRAHWRQVEAMMFHTVVEFASCRSVRKVADGAWPFCRSSFRCSTIEPGQASEEFGAPCSTDEVCGGRPGLGGRGRQRSPTGSSRLDPDGMQPVPSGVASSVTPYRPELLCSLTGFANVHVLMTA